MNRKLIKQAGLFGSAAMLSFAVIGTANAAETLDEAMENIYEWAEDYSGEDCYLDEKTSTGQRYLVMNLPTLPFNISVDVSGPDGRAVRSAANAFCGEMADGEVSAQ